MLATKTSEVDSAQPDQNELPSSSRAARVLLVVGDPNLRISILSRFRLMGIDVEVASNGELALEKLRRSRIDAVFLDLMLKETDSTKVIKRIRKDKEFSELPIYGYAKDYSARQARKAEKAGASKVFDENKNSIDVIVAAVGSGLSRGEANEEAEEVEVMDANADAVEELQEGVNRVVRHLEQLDPKNHKALVDGYGDMRGKVLRLATLSMRAARYDMARLASTLHSLLKVYHEMPKHATPQSFQSVVFAVDVLKLIRPDDKLAKGPQSLEFAAVIVDDEMVSRSIVCSALRSVGFTFELFSHPAETLRYVNGHKTDLLVVNMSSKDNEGYDMCTKVRGQQNNSNIPLLYVSGISDFETQKKVIDSGADAIITKPFIFHELALKAICLALRHRFAVVVEPDVHDAEAEFSDTGAVVESGSVPSGAATSTAMYADMAESDDPSWSDESEANSMGTNRLARHQKPVDGDVGSTGSSFEEQLINDVMNSLIIPDTDDDLELQADVVSREERKEQLTRHIQQKDQEIDEVRQALESEQAHREQLEILVQQLMEAQGEAPSVMNGSTVETGGDMPVSTGGSESAPVPEKVQEELRVLANLTDELRNELERKEADRAELNEQFKSNEIELSNLRMTLEEERRERAALEARLNDPKAPHNEKLQQALEEAKKESDSLSAKVEAVSRELESSRSEGQQLSEEYRKKTDELAAKITTAESTAKEFEQKLAEASGRAEKFQAEISRLEKKLTEKIEGETQQKDTVERELAEARQALQASQTQITQLNQEHASKEDNLKREVEAAQQEVEKARKALDKEAEQSLKLEEQLATATRKLDESVAAHEKLSAEWKQREADLNKAIEDSKHAVARAESDSAKLAERAQQLEKDLNALRKDHEAKLASKVEESGKAEQQRAELEKQLKATSEQLKQAESARDKVISERKHTESRLQEQLAAAQSSAVKNEKDAQKQQARVKELEQEAQKLTSRHEELQKKLSESHNQIGVIEKQKSEFSSKLKQAEGELVQLRSETEKLRSAQQQSVGEVKEQLAAAEKALKEAETRAKHESGLAADLKKQLKDLSAERDQINSRLEEQTKALAAAKERIQQQSAEATKLGQELSTEKKRAAELADKKTSLENSLESTRGMLKQVQSECENLKNANEDGASKFNKKLNEAQHAISLANAATKKEAEKAAKFEAEVTGLWKVRDDLKAKLATEQKFSSKLKGEHAQLEARIEKLQGEWDSTRSALEKKSNALVALEKHQTELAGSNKQLESELSVLRAEKNTHKNELTATERKVKDVVAQLTRATAELEAERGERNRIEARAQSLADNVQQLRENLDRKLKQEKETQNRIAGFEMRIGELETSLEESKSAHEQEKNTRRGVEAQLESTNRDLDGVRKDAGKLLAETKANQARVSELEHQLRVREESLVRVTEHLESERGARRKVEEQIAAVGGELQEVKQALTQSRSHASEQSQQVAALQDRLTAKDDALAKAGAALETERNERGHFEHRSAQMAAEMEALNKDLREHLEAEKNYRNRIAALEKDVRAAHGQLDQARSDLEKEIADRELAEQQIEAAGEMLNKLEQFENAFKDSRLSFDQNQADLESFINRSRTEIEQRDAKLQEESLLRQHLKAELDSALAKIRELEQNGTVEVSRLRAELQSATVEKRRLESEAVNSKFVALNNSRAKRAVVNGMRKQLQPAVEDLMAAARLMLEFELGGDQKEVAKNVLESALNLQTQVRETDVVDLDMTEENEAEAKVVDEKKKPDNSEPAGPSAKDKAKDRKKG